MQQEDEIEHLDRLFAVRVNAATVDPPRNPDQFAGLPTEQQDGRWHLIRADYPLDAFNHVRSLQMTGTECMPSGPCERCWVKNEESGTWDAVHQRLNSLGVKIQQQAAINVRVGYVHAQWQIWSAV